MGDTEILSRPPAIRLATTNVPPPAGLYVTIDDKLQLVLTGSVTNSPVGIRMRLLLPDSTIVINAWDVLSGSPRQRNLFQFSLTEGYILSATVFTLSPLDRGQLYGSLQINRGAISSMLYGQTLTQGYLTSQANLYYPNGPNGYSVEGFGHIRSVVGTTPAPGAVISETVPPLTTWRLHSFRFKLVTDANVAVRIPVLNFDDGVSIFAQIIPAATQAASTSVTYCYGSGIDSIAVATTPYVQGGLPTHMTLTSGFRIRTAGFPLQAGDQISSVTYCVEEFMNV